MILMPAIDLRGGQVVRLKQGLLQDLTVYGTDPADVARHWEAEGAERLHLVDLDAAILGQPQPEVVAAVIRAVKIPVEIGGGLRTHAVARRYRDAGAERLIFGTAAVADPELVTRAIEEWGAMAVAVALDAKDGQVKVAGWLEDTRLDALEFGRRMAGLGVLRLQYTDTARDGTLVGPNVPATEQLARATGLRITASGGVSVLADLKQLRPLDALGVDEVIVGKALYERRFTVREAAAVLAGA